MPPWVLRMRNSRPPMRAGSQPMPAFWVQPKRSPEGRSRSISGVTGRMPRGPGALERTSKRARSPESRISAIGIGMEGSAEPLSYRAELADPLHIRIDLLESRGDFEGRIADRIGVEAVHHGPHFEQRPGRGTAAVGRFLLLRGRGIGAGLLASEAEAA